MMNADRLFMLVDTCANIDEVKHEFPDLDFLTYFYDCIMSTVKQDIGRRNTHFAISCVKRLHMFT